MYELFITNKNYSSWSLRAWALMRQLGLGFEERFQPLAPGSNHQAFKAFSPSGRVPCLRDGAAAVWDSLAIAEYLYERHPEVWPKDAAARAWARSAAAEMHSGFVELRNQCSMNCGLRVQLAKVNAGLAGDLERLNELWLDGLQRFGGPFLAGPAFTAVDAFFCPVAFRVLTYGLQLSPEALAYAARLRELAAMKAWYADALAETLREPDHEEEARRAGPVVEDLRARK